MQPIDIRAGQVWERLQDRNGRTFRYTREVIQITAPDRSLGYKWVVYRTKSGHNSEILSSFAKWAATATLVKEA
jgi:hypothetical protein